MQPPAMAWPLIAATTGAGWEKTVAQRGEEFADIRSVALDEALKVDPCGKYVPGSGQHNGARARQCRKARGQRFTELQAHGVGLAVGQAKQHHAVSLGELDHVACSP
jgi:hypothetical protein